MQNKNADARRTILRYRVQHSLTPNQESFGSNLYNAYDRLGFCDWLSYTPFVQDTSVAIYPSHAGKSLHAVSKSWLKEYPLVLNRVIDEYKKQLTVLDVPSFVSSNANLSNKLRVGWFSGDLSYHPVGRFFLGFFHKKRLHHHHLLFDTCDHGAESRREWFKNTTPLDVFNYSNHSLQQQIQLVREHNLDIAIDLSGWTSATYAWILSRLHLFKSRILDILLLLVCQIWIFG